MTKRDEVGEAEATEEDSRKLADSSNSEEPDATKREEPSEEKPAEEPTTEEKPVADVGEAVEGEEEKPAEVPEEVEEKPARAKKEAEEEEIVEERTYTVPLGKARIMPPRKRAARAMRMLRAFVTKHMKLEQKKKEETEEEEEELGQLIITNEVNERIWSRGIEKPPRKIRVRAAKDKDGNVTVYLAEGE